jgi:hypothetical protein
VRGRERSFHPQERLGEPGGSGGGGGDDEREEHGPFALTSTYYFNCEYPRTAGLGYWGAGGAATGAEWSMHYWADEWSMSMHYPRLARELVANMEFYPF